MLPSHTTTAAEPPGLNSIFENPVIVIYKKDLSTRRSCSDFKNSVNSMLPPLEMTRNVYSQNGMVTEVVMVFGPKDLVNQIPDTSHQLLICRWQIQLKAPSVRMALSHNTLLR